MLAQEVIALLEASPEVGVGWYLPEENEVIAEMQALRDARLDSMGYADFGVVLYGKIHAQEWARVVRRYKEQYPGLPDTPWNFYPRMRVSFYTEEYKFEVVLSPELMNDGKAKAAIINTFSLPSANTIFREESEYTADKSWEGVPPPRPVRKRAQA